MSMHDAKNNYLISIQVANSIKKKFYYKDMVTVQDVTFASSTIRERRDAQSQFSNCKR